MVLAQKDWFTIISAEIELAAILTIWNMSRPEKILCEGSGKEPSMPLKPTAQKGIPTPPKTHE